jgi:hypothetical protein
MGFLSKSLTAAAALSNLCSFAQALTTHSGVPASNSAQSSILSQQAYNLCLYEASNSTLQATNQSCTSFGSSRLTPNTTTVISGGMTGTFIASFLTEYGGLGCQGTTISTTDRDGVSTTMLVGELGQGQLKYQDIEINRLTAI